MSHSDSSASTADDVALMWATNDRASKCKRCSSPALFRTCCDTYVCNACYFSENICPLCKTGTTAMSLSPTPVEKPNRLASRCAMLPAFALMILPIALMAQYILMQQNITLTLIEVEGCAPGAERRIVCVKASALQGETGNPRDADRGSWARCEEDSPFVSERLPTSQHPVGWPVHASLYSTGSGLKQPTEWSTGANETPAVDRGRAAVLGGIPGCVCAPACVVNKCLYRESRGAQGWDFESELFLPLVTQGRDDLLRGPLPHLWDRISLGRSSTSCGSVVGGHALVFGGPRSSSGRFRSEEQPGAVRELRTLPVDATAGGAWVFWLRYGTGLGPDEDRCPAVARAQVEFESSSDSGVSWQRLAVFPVEQYKGLEFRKATVQFPPVQPSSDATPGGEGQGQGHEQRMMTGTSNRRVFRWIQRDYFESAEAWAIDAIALQQQLSPDWQDTASSEGAIEATPDRTITPRTKTPEFFQRIRDATHKAACCSGCGGCDQAPEGNAGVSRCSGYAAGGGGRKAWRIASVSELLVALALGAGCASGAWTIGSGIVRVTVDACVKPLLLAPVRAAGLRKQEAAAVRATRDAVLREVERRRKRRRLRFHAELIRRKGLDQAQSEALFIHRHGGDREKASLARRERVRRNAIRREIEPKGVSSVLANEDPLGNNNPAGTDEELLDALGNLVTQGMASLTSAIASLCTMWWCCCCCCSLQVRKVNHSVGPECTGGQTTRPSAADLVHAEAVDASATSGTIIEQNHELRARHDKLRTKYRRGLALSLQGSGHVSQELLNADIDVLENEEAAIRYNRDGVWVGERWRHSVSSEGGTMEPKVHMSLLDSNNEIRQDVLDRTRRAMARGVRYDDHESRFRSREGVGSGLQLDEESMRAAERGVLMPLPFVDHMQGTRSLSTYVRPEETEAEIDITSRALTPLVPGATLMRPFTRDAGTGTLVRTDRYGAAMRDGAELLERTYAAARSDKGVGRSGSPDRSDAERRQTWARLEAQMDNRAHKTADRVQQARTTHEIDIEPKWVTPGTSGVSLQHPTEAISRAQGGNEATKPVPIDSHSQDGHGTGLLEALLSRGKSISAKEEEVGSVSTHTSDISTGDLDRMSWDHAVCRGGALLHGPSLSFQPTESAVLEADKLQDAQTARQQDAIEQRKSSSALDKYTVHTSAWTVAPDGSQTRALQESQLLLTQSELSAQIRRRASRRRRAVIRAALRSGAFEEVQKALAALTARPRVLQWTIHRDSIVAVAVWAAAAGLTAVGALIALVSRLRSLGQSTTYRLLGIDALVPDMLMVVAAMCADGILAYVSAAASVSCTPAGCMRSRCRCACLVACTCISALPPNQPSPAKPGSSLSVALRIVVPQSSVREDLPDFAKRVRLYVKAGLPAPLPTRDRKEASILIPEGNPAGDPVNTDTGSIRGASFAPGWIGWLAVVAACLDLMPLLSLSIAASRALPGLGAAFAITAGVKLLIDSRQPCMSLCLAVSELCCAQLGLRTPRARMAAQTACCGTACRRGAVLGLCSLSLPLIAIGLIASLAACSYRTVAGREYCSQFEANTVHIIVWSVVAGVSWGCLQACRATVPLRLRAGLTSMPVAVGGPPDGHANRIDLLLRIQQRRRGMLTRCIPLPCGCCEGKRSSLPGLGLVDGLLDDAARVLGCMPQAREHFALPVPWEACEQEWVFLPGVIGGEGLLEMLGAKGLARLWQQARVDGWGSMDDARTSHVDAVGIASPVGDDNGDDHDKQNAFDAAGCAEAGAEAQAEAGPGAAGDDTKARSAIAAHSSHPNDAGKGTAIQIAKTYKAWVGGEDASSRSLELGASGRPRHPPRNVEGARRGEADRELENLARELGDATLTNLPGSITSDMQSHPAEDSRNTIRQPSVLDCCVSSVVHYEHCVAVSGIGEEFEYCAEGSTHKD